ncbi:uncharacterized protein LOC142980712 [Anticarsia gemmatalis]|uniref:uncharacterized protein LOC142980712 n=1 Tax=Anticarsia gemmatalis TaxID=129554 RepID=UPI003F77450E
MFAGLTFFALIAFPIVYTAPVLDEDMLLYWRRSQPSECEPFTTYMVNCNKCVCSADGTEYCTRMTCSAKKNVVVEEADKPQKEVRSARPAYAKARKTTDDEKNLSPIDREDYQ